MCGWAGPGLLDATEALSLAHGQRREEEVSHWASVNPPGTNPHGFYPLGKKSWFREPGREQGSSPARSQVGCGPAMPQGLHEGSPVATAISRNWWWGCPISKKGETSIYGIWCTESVPCTGGITMKEVGEPEQIFPKSFLLHPQQWKEENLTVVPSFPLTYLQGPISLWASVCSSAKWDLQHAKRRCRRWFLSSEPHRAEGIRRSWGSRRGLAAVWVGWGTLWRPGEDARNWVPPLWATARLCLPLDESASRRSPNQRQGRPLAAMHRRLVLFPWHRM